MQNRPEIPTDMAITEVRTEAAPTQTPTAPPPPESSPEVPKPRVPAADRIASIIVAVVIAAVASLSIWYLVRSQPLLVQGEGGGTRLAIAARGQTRPPHLA